MSGIVRLQEQIAGLLEGGAAMSEVERRVIDPASLGSEQKSALWLFAQALSGQTTAGYRLLSETSAARTNGGAARAGMDARPGHGPPIA